MFYRLAAFALLSGLYSGFGRCSAVMEAKGFIACLDDMAVMCQAVQECRGHLGISEDGAPFGEGQIGRDHHTGVLVEFREQMK